jgi:hypothetical protein
MITIKKYWKLFIGAFISIVGFGLLKNKFKNALDKPKLDDDVNNAVKHVAVQQVHIDNIEEQKIEVEKTIDAVEKEIEELNKEIVNPQITDAVTVEEAKENIIKKTSRKRKYKKKDVK